MLGELPLLAPRAPRGGANTPCRRGIRHPLPVILCLAVGAAGRRDRALPAPRRWACAARTHAPPLKLRDPAMLGAISLVAG